MFQPSLASMVPGQSLDGSVRCGFPKDQEPIWPAQISPEESHSKNIHMQVVLSCNLFKTVSVWKDVKTQTHSNLGQYICRVFSGSVLPTHSGLAAGRSLTNVYSTENFKER